MNSQPHFLLTGCHFEDYNFLKFTRHLHFLNIFLHLIIITDLFNEQIANSSLKKSKTLFEIQAFN